MSWADGLRSFVGHHILGHPQPLTFDDTVNTWAEAQRRSAGYDQAHILTQVSEATQVVMRGEAAYERDGIAFTEPDYRWPIAYALMCSALENNRLAVLDVGGSLGSTFWQHKNVLPDVNTSWTVLEQPPYVEEGTRICGDAITFVSSFDATSIDYDTALFSSVLQYLDDPWKMLRSVMSTGVTQIVIDRTPMYAGDVDIPTVQKVPAHIYEASYPSWILSRQKLRDALAGWHVVAEFPGLEPQMKTRSGVEFTWSGLIAHRART